MWWRTEFYHYEPIFAAWPSRYLLLIWLTYHVKIKGGESDGVLITLLLITSMTRSKRGQTFHIVNLSSMSNVYSSPFPLFHILLLSIFPGLSFNHFLFHCPSSYSWPYSLNTWGHLENSIKYRVTPNLLLPCVLWHPYYYAPPSRPEGPRHCPERGNAGGALVFMYLF